MPPKASVEKAQAEGRYLNQHTLNGTISLAAIFVDYTPSPVTLRVAHKDTPASSWRRYNLADAIVAITAIQESMRSDYTIVAGDLPRTPANIEAKKWPKLYTVVHRDNPDIFNGPHYYAVTSEATTRVWPFFDADNTAAEPFEHTDAGAFDYLCHIGRGLAEHFFPLLPSVERVYIGAWRSGSDCKMHVHLWGDGVSSTLDALKLVAGKIGCDTSVYRRHQAFRLPNSCKHGQPTRTLQPYAMAVYHRVPGDEPGPTRWTYEPITSATPAESAVALRATLINKVSDYRGNGVVASAPPTSPLSNNDAPSAWLGGKSVNEARAEEGLARKRGREQGAYQTQTTTLLQIQGLQSCLVDAKAAATAFIERNVPNEFWHTGSPLPGESTFPTILIKASDYRYSCVVPSMRFCLLKFRARGLQDCLHECCSFHFVLTKDGIWVSCFSDGCVRWLAEHKLDPRDGGLRVNWGGGVYKPPWQAFTCAIQRTSALMVDSQLGIASDPVTPTTSSPSSSSSAGQATSQNGVADLEVA